MLSLLHCQLKDFRSQSCVTLMLISFVRMYNKAINKLGRNLSKERILVLSSMYCQLKDLRSKYMFDIGAQFYLYIS